MKSIYIRNFAATAALVSVCFLIVMLIFVGMGRDFIFNEYVSGMEQSANEAARTASVMAETDSLSSWVLSRTLTSIGRITGDHVFVTDTDGFILSCSDEQPTCEHMGMRISADVMESISPDEQSRLSGTLDGIYDEERIIITVPVKIGEDDSRLVGYVFESNKASNMMNAWRKFHNFSGMIAVGVFFLVLFLALINAKRMARPLDEMAAASRKFARGDFSVRVRQVETPSYEMGALIESFNSMADSLEKAEERRTEFISNVSHELRTPMTTIAGFADGILDGTIPKEEEEKYLRSIRDETRRLSRLVRNMLDVSRMRANAADKSKWTTFDLTELLLQTMLSFESRATEKGIDVFPQMPDTPIMVKADRDAITQVIYNLTDNAVKFAAKNSTITVRLYKENGKAYVAIKDVGETIPPEDLPLIFDRFHKSDRSRSLDKTGVGLGLYLVKSIINSHDEDIAVRSENGETEFVFTLALV